MHRAVHHEARVETHELPQPGDLPSDRSSERPDEGPACLSCRRRKLRCSRETPACTQCTRLNCECVYDQRKQKPGLKTGAVEGLNRRLEVLEKLMLDNNGEPKQGNALSATDMKGCLFHASLLLANQFGAVVDGNSSTNAADLNCQRQLGPPNNDSTDSGREFPNSSRKRRRDDDSCDVDHAPRITSRQIDTAKELPAQDVVEKVIDRFFDTIHHWMPIVHRTRFESRLKNPTEYSKLTVLLHALIAITLRHVEPDSLDGSFDVEEQIQISRNAVMQNAFDDLSVENAQALLLIAFDKVGSGHMVAAWSILGHLTRAVEYLELNIEPTDAPDQSLLVPLRLLEKPRSWAEAEERRRVFWNTFLLDRFCVVTSGWPTSLTADNVNVSLPCNGALWRRGEPATTPFLGLWDKSSAKIGTSITYLPTHKASPGEQSQATSSSPVAAPHVDTSSLGAVAYRIEATASMRQIASFFLQQPVNFQNRGEVSQWLTRFKELDLRLVHWKQFLSPRWRDGNVSRDEKVVKMDTNLTLAHVVHNTSMILLHQHIAYPPVALSQAVSLPSACSVETCQLAAAEVHAIAEKYLRYSDVPMVNSEFAFCVFIAGRIMLVHWRFLSRDLGPDFFGLVECLEEMSKRWCGPRAKSDEQSQRRVPMHHLDLAARYARQLRNLHQKCLDDSTFVTEILFYNGANAAMETTDFMLSRPRDISNPQQLRRAPTETPDPHTFLSPRSRVPYPLKGTRSGDGELSTQSQIDSRNAMYRYQQPLIGPQMPPQVPIYNLQPASYTNPRISHAERMAIASAGAHPGNPAGPISYGNSAHSDDELAATSHSLLEQQFATLDRIIRYDGTEFSFDPNAYSWGYQQ